MLYIISIMYKTYDRMKDDKKKLLLLEIAKNS